MEDLESIEQDVKNNLDSGELEGAADDTARLSVSAGEQEVIGLLLHTTEVSTLPFYWFCGMQEQTF